MVLISNQLSSSFLKPVWTSLCCTCLCWYITMDNIKSFAKLKPIRSFRRNIRTEHVNSFRPFLTFFSFIFTKISHSSYIASLGDIILSINTNLKSYCSLYFACSTCSWIFSRQMPNTALHIKIQCVETFPVLIPTLRAAIWTEIGLLYIWNQPALSYSQRCTMKTQISQQWFSLLLI